MLEVFRNHEKRTSEEAGSNERNHRLPHRSPNPFPLPSGRIGPQVPVCPSSSKMHISLHPPPTVPMQLASNVMVVPPQQIATSTSHQSLMNTFHKRKGFPLAVARPIIREDPNLNLAMAHTLPKGPPPKIMETRSINATSTQDSPLDLSTPLDLSVKRKKDPDETDIGSQNAIKRQRTVEASDGMVVKSVDSSRKCSKILSKPPPIYPGLHRNHSEHFRQQRKVHPLIHESSQKDLSIFHPRYLQQKVTRSKELEEAKLRMARQTFALQSSKILHNSGHPSHKDAHLPVKRAHAAIPPLVTSSVGSSRHLTPREHAHLLATNQQISEHSRMLHEEKLLARAVVMGIPIDKEPYHTQRSLRSSQLIKQNGTVDSEMEEALRQMMQRPPHHPSVSVNNIPKLHPHDSATSSSERKKRLLEQAAYFEYMKKQMLLRSIQQQSQQVARHQERPLSSSPPVSCIRLNSHQENQELMKRRILYGRKLGHGIPQTSMVSVPRAASNSPPTAATREGTSKMKLVQGVGTNSGPQYKYSLKDFEPRHSSMVAQVKSKIDPHKDLKHLHQHLQREHKLKSHAHSLDYLREYQNIRAEFARHDQVVPTQNGAGQGHVGPTASRGPASQGFPHPVSRLTQSPLEPAITTAPSTTTPFIASSKSQESIEITSASPSSYRSRKNLLNPERARDHILASMNPAVRDIFQQKNQEKQKELVQTLRKNHNMQLQWTNGFAINFRDVIAHHISKCIDESSDNSEIIDLTSEPPDMISEKSLGDVSGRAGSPQTNLPCPVSIENLKQDMTKDDPPPLIKMTDHQTGFVPLNSNSVIMSGAVTCSKLGASSLKNCTFRAISDEPLYPAISHMSVLKSEYKPEDIKVEVEENIQNEIHMEEVGIKLEQHLKQEVCMKTEEESKNSNNLQDPAESSKLSLSLKASDVLMNESSSSIAGSVKSVSYDPRRKILAALNEQVKSLLDSPESAEDHFLVTKELEINQDKFQETKIIARADRDDKDCKLPDQLLEGDDDVDEEKVCENKEETKPALAETAEMEEATTVEESPEVEETPRPRRKRKRRVRRYYHIAPRRASSRKGRQAAMVSSYHRDTRYEQEIEKEQQKVMERRRRRSAVMRSQDLNPEAEQEQDDNIKLDDVSEMFEDGEIIREVTRKKRRRAVTTSPTESTDDATRMSEDSPESNEEAFRRLFGERVELKVRIQRKDLTGKYHENDNWQIVSEENKPPKRNAWRSLFTGRKSNGYIKTVFDRNQSSTSGLFSRQLNGMLKRRRRVTNIKRMLLQARILPDQHDGPAVPPPPKELKRLAVNKKLGETLLHKAARLGHDDSALYCINYCTQDINAKDNAGYTPLHESCANGRLRVAKHMINKGADVNGSAADGTRPVHDAIDNAKVELGRLLLAYGGDPLIATYSGRTTRKLARSHATKALIHGYLKDINGRLLAPVEELDNLRKVNFNIRFHSLVQTPEDLIKSGSDFMAGAPEPTAEEDVFMIEFSDKPLLPSIPAYLKEPQKFANWLLVPDVLQRLNMSRSAFLYNHRDVKLYSVLKQEIEGAIGSSSEVKSFLGRVIGKSVELFELDDHIREILGTEIELVK